MKKTGAFAMRMHTAKDIWSLCRVHTHGKDCTFACWVVAAQALFRAGQRAGARQCTLHGNGRAHGKGECTAKGWRARQRMASRQRSFCRAYCPKRTAKILCRARRCRLIFAVRVVTAKPLPCNLVARQRAVFR